jgi:uncharacterized ferritin-like protein (DUF455 family)
VQGADRIHASLHAAALACVRAATPDAKLAATRATAAAWRRGELSVAAGPHPDVQPIDAPGRPPRPHLVDPRALAQRGLGSAAGRAALVHAVAHIEFNAIDLAWDAVYRFRDMPRAFYDDWVAVADDEARHFGLLAGRLAEHGYGYGDFDAHDGLWRMAVRTSHDCLARMALVPRVLEARGLDVTPHMIARLRAVGDLATVAILETILREEIAHVAAGSRWFQWCCDRAGRDPQASFAALLAEYLPGPLKGPLNREARIAAGFSAAELAWLEPAA